ncbi:MAG: peptidoglycan DD-metalloendopeptidase family protein [Pseudomonadota bacterium]|nr:peptidoglycan DD-metalloendopeptidase family protein [Pseudomonadota bacterium]
MASTGGASAAWRLSRLRHRLESLERSLEHVRGQRDSQREALRVTEEHIGETVRALRQLGIERREQSRRLAYLRTEQEQEHVRIKGQMDALAREARATYALGRQEYLKLLLSQEDPATISRVLTYYQYLQKARAARIAAARSTLAHLALLSAQIRTRQQALTRLRSEQANRRQTLLRSEAHRRILLAALNHRVVSQSREVRRLQTDERRLAHLVQGIGHEVVGRSPVPLPGPDSRFAQFRGRLPLPVAGRIIDRFGQPEGIGNLTWQGVFLAAPQGSRVISVFGGRVAYASWLRGFGLLMIVDHGDGYMSLYAHNQSLYERTGDWVSAGQTIATVGDTGGAPQPGLYFEVLHDERPVNPLDWCKIR